MASNTQVNLRVACGRLLVSAFIAAVFLGVAVGPDPEHLAGMGTNMGDIDRLSLPDVLVTHLDGGTQNLYTKLGVDIFMDARYESGAGRTLGANRPGVVWPNGHSDVINDVDANPILTVVEGGGMRDGVRFDQ
jgi:hypothetical protein